MTKSFCSGLRTFFVSCWALLSFFLHMDLSPSSIIMHHSRFRLILTLSFGFPYSSSSTHCPAIHPSPTLQLPVIECI